MLGVDHKGVVLLANHAPAQGPGPPGPGGPPLPGGDPPEGSGRGAGAGVEDGRAQRGGGGAPASAPGLPDHRLTLPRQRGDPAGRRPDLSRRHRAAARGPGAARLRGQRVPRAAHAPHLHPRLRGGAGGRGGQRARHRAALPGQDPHPRRPHGRPGGRPPGAVAARVRGAPPALRGGPAFGSGGRRAGLVRPPGPDPRASSSRRATSGPPSWSPTRTGYAASWRTWWRTR